MTAGLPDTQVPLRALPTALPGVAGSPFF